MDAKLTVTPGDLLQLSISDGASGASLSITDLSTPGQAPAADLRALTRT